MKDLNFKKITRIVTLLNMLCSGKLVVSDAARDTGVSVRTIQRDIIIIEEAGFPISSIRPGEFSFVEGYSLNKVKLTEKEASLLVLMTDVIKPLGKHFANSFETLKSKVLNADKISPFYIKINDSVQYKQTDITEKIKDAITAYNIINIKYSKEKQQEINYQIKPLKIINYDGFWYLMGLKTDNNAMRTFKLHQITAAEKTNKHFKVGKNIDKLLDESPNIWFTGTRNKKITLKILPEVSRYFKEKKILPLQKIKKENQDGSLILESVISQNEEAIRIIVQWLPYVKVLDADLKMAIKELLLKSLKNL